MSARAHSDEPGLILSHGELGPEGVLGEWLAARGRRYVVHHVWRDGVPRLGRPAFVASLGSERSANDAAVPWVAGEIALLREAVAADVPVLGLCFGGQSLALALGGAVRRARPPQVGWFEVTGDGVPRGPWFHWHYEQFTVPPGAEELARSPAGPAVYRRGPHVGLQFHPEVTLDVIGDWARSGAELAKVGVDPAALVEESARRHEAARTAAFELFAWWEDVALSGG